MSACVCFVYTIGIVWLGSVNLHHHHYDTDRVLCVAGDRRGDDLSSAVADSHRIYSLHLLAARLHNKRLNSLLEHNGLKRVPVAADGNCFFSAASLHLIGHNHKSLREALCVHIENNKDLYTSVFQAVSDSDKRCLVSLTEIQQLRENGTWNSNVNDILPLALADLTNRRVKIFSSRVNTPHLDVTPTLKGPYASSIFKPIYLAFLVPRGQPEHYDGCLLDRRSIYSLYVATFDIESVLPTAYDPTGQTFYKRKLSVCNLSVFSLADKSAACYIWTEVEGQRGSNEIGTCLYKHLESLPKSVHHVVLFSDTCTGQNRNKYITTALHHTVQNIPNIETIDQKFLERGHSHMECDTMHAAIERAKKGIKIHHPDHWLTVCQCAQGSDPFTNVPLEHEAFYDFKDVARTTIRNTKTDTNGSRVNWLKIKWIRVVKSDSDAVYFKYRMPDQFCQLKIRGSSRRGHPHKMTTTLPVLYTNRLNISEVKKKDLLDLCHSGVIPRQHHDYYFSLPSSSAATDCLADVDITEEQDDTDDE